MAFRLKVRWIGRAVCNPPSHRPTERSPKIEMIGPKYTADDARRFRIEFTQRPAL